MTESTAVVPVMSESKSIKLVEPKTLIERISQIHDQIARRAFEIFQGDGGFWGHDLDNWFKAEAELLHPAHININESEGAFSIEAELPGFDAKDLQVSLEPRRLTISAKKETSKEDKKKGKTIYKEQCSSELLRVVDLPAEVDATKATATFKNGVLELNVPKAAQTKAARVEVKAA